MLNGHYDTVTLAGYDGDPLSATHRDGKAYGRGTCDMKSGVAAMMVAAARAAEGNLAGDLIVACVADEEHASIGTEEVLRHFTADTAIVTEPTDLQIVTAHKGFAWIEVTVHGRAAHGSRPDIGVDAIAKAGRFLIEVDRWNDSLRSAPSHPRLGAGSVHASLIRGGQELSSYPAECHISLERRTVPGETADTVRAELAGIIDRISRDDASFSTSVKMGLVRDAFEVSEVVPLVIELRAAADKRLGTPPPFRADPYWTDCALLAKAGITALLFGAHGAGAHGPEEWVDVESVKALSDILQGTIRAVCGAKA